MGIRNTPEEFETYPEEIDRLLDRVFDELGMVVSGWSADWDIGLRTAIEQCLGLERQCRTWISALSSRRRASIFGMRVWTAFP